MYVGRVLGTVVEYKRKMVSMVLDRHIYYSIFEKCINRKDL